MSALDIISGQLIGVAEDSDLSCPSCGLPADMVDRFMLDGSPGPVEHVKIACAAGHWFTLPLDSLRLTGVDRVESDPAGAVSPAGV